MNSVVVLAILCGFHRIPEAASFIKNKGFFVLPDDESLSSTKGIFYTVFQASRVYLVVDDSHISLTSVCVWRLLCCQVWREGPVFGAHYTHAQCLSLTSQLQTAISGLASRELQENFIVSYLDLDFVK